MTKKYYLLTLSLVLFSIAATYFVTSYTAANAQQTAPAKVADNEFQAGGALYMQYAGEYRALAYQAFSAARMTIDADDKARKKLTKIERKKPRAVVVDIDETILDNSPQQGYLIKHRLPFDPAIFTAWVNKRAAKAIPGAVDFLNYAAKQGYKVFYVSNRSDAKEKPATIDNLKAVGFPDANADTVQLKTTVSSKEPRRMEIGKTYRVVVYCGDNLNDFAQIFEGKSPSERLAAVDDARADWGHKFIALPNVMYGDWELALYGYKNLGDEAVKTATRLSLLQSFEP